MTRFRFYVFLLGALIVSMGRAAQADNATTSGSAAGPEVTHGAGEFETGGRITLLDENDYFASHDDRHYTQGAELSYLSDSVRPGGFWDRPFAVLAENTPIFGGAEHKRKYEVVVGQSIFTPTNTLAVDPSGKDRPYAAWFYTGGSLLQETTHRDYHTLENVELLMGVVGPAALGGVTQNDFHEFINEPASQGRENQLTNEPGFMVTYERKWRFEEPLAGDFGVDAIPEAGVTLGNVLTYGEVGGIVRIGQNLSADYGPGRVRPSLSGTAWFDPEQLKGRLGWYLFAGTQGRAVAHNIFLDGNTVARSPSVSTRPLVADFMGGVSLFWSTAARIDFTVTQRTKEFYSQTGHPDRFGGVNLTVQF
ncbi:MAG: lipid A deacylase LpxR family protein [Pseudomonadota bacterium]|nr:lipid A deacylase LpxR family protein [Pseudomonadota bacterium]